MAGMKNRGARWICLPLVLAPLWAAAQELPQEGVGREFLVGVALASSVGHIGDGGRTLSRTPVWHFQLGPVRVSRGRASALLGTGIRSYETGVSANVYSVQQWHFGASLRLDSGRSFDGDPVWGGLPDIRTTLRGRASAQRALGDRWSWGASADQDLLGRDGGLRLSSGIHYHYPLSERTRWDFGLSATWGNGRYMQTHFGITPAGAATVGSAPHAPGGGLEGLQLGWNTSTALSPHWVLFGGVGVSTLRGDAARSPLVNRRTTSSATVGLAYRNRR